MDRLNQLDFAHAPARAGSSILYGSWRLKHPRFTRLSHALWWNRYVVNDANLVAGCPGADMHAWIGGPEALARVEAAGVAPNALTEVAHTLGTAADLVALMYDGNDPFPPHDGWLAYCDLEHTVGAMPEYRNVHYFPGGMRPHTCSHGSAVADLEENARERMAWFASEPTPTERYDNVFWTPTPASGFFQHFLQDVMKRLAQAWLLKPQLFPWTPSRPGVEAPKGTVHVTAVQDLLLDRFPIVGDMYRYLGWEPPTQLVQEHILEAKHVYYACPAPPLHPLLWQVGQQAVLRVARTPPAERNKIVYCSRTRGGPIENMRRMVANDDRVVDMLRQWAAPAPAGVGGRAAGRGSSGYTIDFFDHRKYTTVDELVAYWSTARVLVGAHGGCMSNLFFMPSGGAVLEFFPLVAGLRADTSNTGKMVYLQATMLDHQYWMLPSIINEGEPFFQPSSLDLCTALMESLGRPAASPTASCADLVALVEPPLPAGAG